MVLLHQQLTELTGNKEKMGVDMTRSAAGNKPGTLRLCRLLGRVWSSLLMVSFYLQSNC